MIMKTFEIMELVAHRVYQRDEFDRSDIPFALKMAEDITGTVEGRFGSETYVTPWRALGRMDGTTFAGTFAMVPVGQHRIEIRIVGDEGEGVIAEAVDPVFVGDLWIMAGQSNMDGCGKMTTDVESPQVGVSCFYMGDTWGIAEDPLSWLNESLDPVNWSVPEEQREEAIRRERCVRDRGASLGLPFGKELLRLSGVPIGLVTCSHGGTTMAQWDTALAGEGGRSLYGAMLRKVRKLGGKVKGCLWYQGESEALNGETATAAYRNTMVNWVSNLRNDLGDPGLPFIYAQLSHFYSGDEKTGRLWNCVQQDQLALEELIDHSALIPTSDAALADVIHLDGPSLVKVGHRMAWRAMALAHGQPVAMVGPRPAEFSWNADRTELAVTLSDVNGLLANVNKVQGFRVDANGIRLPHSASVGEDRLHIVLRFEQPAPEGCMLWHGAGINPTVNTMDDKGIPLPVFGPVTV